MRTAILALTSSLVLSGCASVVRGTTEQVAFTSAPAGAAVALSNGFQCASTPCSLEVPRKDEFTATFTKPGYNNQSVRVGTVVSGGGVAAGAGNLVAGGLIGVGVDAYNGANLDHSPNPVAVTLQPTAPAPAPAKRAPTS